MSNDFVQFLPLVLLAILFWLLVLRPARKRQREFSGLQSRLEPGLEIMLASGIHGQIVTAGDDTIELRIARDVVVTVARQAVGRIIEPAGSMPETAVDPESE